MFSPPPDSADRLFPFRLRGRPFFFPLASGRSAPPIFFFLRRFAPSLLPLSCGRHHGNSRLFLPSRIRRLLFPFIEMSPPPSSSFEGFLLSLSQERDPFPLPLSLFLMVKALGLLETLPSLSFLSEKALRYHLRPPISDLGVFCLERGSLP